MSACRQRKRKRGKRGAFGGEGHFKKVFPWSVAHLILPLLGGSMSAGVGEKFVLAAEEAIRENSPLICFSTSGGARMQEGLFSLFQMARTSTVLARLGKAKLPFISVLTDPTMGGVSASLAMLGDVIIAEPKAQIGFSGPRVIEQTIGEVLPEGFQKSESLLEKGAIDMIVDRRHLPEVIARLLSNLLRLPLPDTSDDMVKNDDEAAKKQQNL